MKKQNLTNKSIDISTKIYNNKIQKLDNIFIYDNDKLYTESFFIRELETNHLKINNDEYIPLKKSDFDNWLYPKFKNYIKDYNEYKLYKIRIRLATLCFLSVIPASFILLIYINSGYVFNYTFFNGIGITISIFIYLILYQKLSNFMLNGE